MIDHLHACHGPVSRNVFTLLFGTFFSLFKGVSITRAIVLACLKEISPFELSAKKIVAGVLSDTPGARTVVCIV